MTERVFTFVKPRHSQLYEGIFEYLDYHGKRIVTRVVPKAPRRLVEEHYAEHLGKRHYETTVNGIADRIIVIGLYEGNVDNFRNLIGYGDPSKANPGTVRNRFSKDSYERAALEGREVWNVIHCSDSVPAAEREISIWREFLKI